MQVGRAECQGSARQQAAHGEVGGGEGGGGWRDQKIRRSMWAPVRPECTLSRKLLSREERAEKGQEEAGISAATAAATAEGAEEF